MNTSHEQTHNGKSKKVGELASKGTINPTKDTCVKSRTSDQNAAMRREGEVRAWRANIDCIIDDWGVSSGDNASTLSKGFHCLR